MNLYLLGTLSVLALLITIFMAMVGWANREVLFAKSDETDAK